MSEKPNYAELWMKAGWNLDLVLYDGEVMPEIMVETLSTLKSRGIRDDDVLLSTFPKSGTHWVWEILNMIVAGEAEYAKHWQNYAWLEYRTESELEALDSPRVLHTHMLPRMQPTELWRKRCKIVYVERNLKDVAVSSYNQNIKQVWGDNPLGVTTYTGTWDDFLHFFLRGGLFSTWFDHVNQWHSITEDHPNVDICYIRYEDLKKDCAAEILKISKFLDRPLSERKCREIADACSFRKLKHAAETEKDQTYHFKWNEGEDSYFRKGIVGDWKNYFTVAQSEMTDELYEEKMRRKYPNND